MKNQQPSKRFTILNRDDKFKWVLPDDMAKYTNSHFNQYVQEQDLKESILIENPISSNITEVKKLDKFTSHLLKKNNSTSVCALHTTLEKIQKKNIYVMGLLSKVWHAHESATIAPDDEADLTTEDLLNLVQETVLLVGQTNNAISYHRRLSTLVDAMKCSSQAKSIIKAKNPLLENSGKELFGKDFRDQITDTVKAQKQSKELLFNVFQQKHNKKPFWKGPRKVSFIMEDKTLASRKEAMIPIAEEGSTTKAMHSSKTQVTRTATFFKEIPQLIPLGELSSAHQLVKKNVLQFKDSSSTTGREIRVLPGKLGQTNKRSEYFAATQGTSNSIPLQTKRTKANQTK